MKENGIDGNETWSIRVARGVGHPNGFPGGSKAYLKFHLFGRLGGLS